MYSFFLLGGNVKVAVFLLWTLIEAMTKLIALDKTELRKQEAIKVIRGPKSPPQKNRAARKSTQQLTWAKIKHTFLLKTQSEEAKTLRTS